MKKIHLLTVGKLKDHHLKSLEKNYIKRINQFEIKIHELKSHQEDLGLEAKEILNKLKQINGFLYLLAEKGHEFSSHEFSHFIFDQLDHFDSLIFVIGGASGFGKEILEREHQKISLSKLTYPHQFAKLIFIEQLYRAQSIKVGHPYHK